MRKTVTKAVKHSLGVFGIDAAHLYRAVCCWSLVQAQRQQDLVDLVKILEKIVPDLSEQYSRNSSEDSAYGELKIRSMHAFQCELMLKAVENLSGDGLMVVDIGDSAGTHMLYLKELTRNDQKIETISVNLDPRAIEKIKGRGLKAILKRAEDIEPEDIGGEVDLFTSFEMIEHLHNPTIFFRRLAKKTSCNKMLITIPYLRQSRVGLHHIRSQSQKIIYAEDEHIFELSPDDWKLLLLHSGWRVTHDRIYYQYPRRRPPISAMLRNLWKIFDYEGFWGAILEKDLKYSDLYQDWDE